MAVYHCSARHVTVNWSTEEKPVLERLSTYEGANSYYQYNNFFNKTEVKCGRNIEEGMILAWLSSKNPRNTSGEECQRTEILAHTFIQICFSIPVIAGQ